jgi:anionic cell wall polymer biosynthesis LytR-Cps2A-Psr (LCP) family protein
MTLFAEVVDAIGGLEVIIPEGGIDGRTETDRSERLVFPEGPQHLDGTQSLTLARMRSVSVFERAEHQNLVLCALREKIGRPETILRLPAIIDSFLSNVQTDLTPEQISQLACLGTQMPRSNITFTGFPLDLFEPTETYDAVLEQDVFIWEADFHILRSYVARFQTGTWPSSSSGGPKEPETSTCE